MARDVADAEAGGLEHFTDADGVVVGYRRWIGDVTPRAIVVISHGASEHSGRYGRFASLLVGRGYAVFAIDHRGHGATSASTGVGRAGPRGWDAMVDDLGELIEMARTAHPSVPVVLFAHSMGSFVAQLFAEQRGAELDGLVLSATSGSIDALDDAIALLDAMVAEGAGDQPAPLFAAFNLAFEPARTPFDWLSRDADEVDKYVADQWCGDNHPLTIEFALDMLRHLAEAWDPANEARIPTDLPMLFITGEADPVSDGARTVRELEARYRALGVVDLTAHYVPDARHELLNEINRDEIQPLVIDWLDRVTDP